MDLMRRFAIIFILSLLASFLVSCVEQVEPEFPVQGDTEIPIEFAISSTRAAIRGEENLVSNTSIFGMYAVDPSLNSLSEDDGLNMRNQLCRYVAPTAESGSSLRFGYQSADKTIYFPMFSDNAYTFYTYHSWTSDIVDLDAGALPVSEPDDAQTVSEVSSTDRQVCASIPLATSHDVLWAKSQPGFNASYIKETGNVPTFSFKHPAAGVSMKVVLDEDSQTKISKGDHLRITQISYKGAESGKIATKGALCVIDLDKQENEGKFLSALQFKNSVLWPNPTMGSGNLNFDLIADADGDGVVETCLEDAQQLYTEVFIMPMDEPLEVTVSLRRHRISSSGTITGNWDLGAYTFTLDPKNFGAMESGYKAGIMYNYKIVVKYTNDNPNTPANDQIQVAIVPESAPDKVADIEVVPPFEVSDVSVTAKTATIKMKNIPAGLEYSVSGSERASVGGEVMTVSTLTPDTDYSLTFFQGDEILETVDFKTDPEPASHTFGRYDIYAFSFSFNVDSSLEEYYSKYSWEVWSKLGGELIYSGEDYLYGERVTVDGLEWNTEYVVRVFLGHKVDGFVREHTVKTYNGTDPPVLYLNNYDIEWEYDPESGEIMIVPLEGWVEDVTKLEYILQKSISDIPALDDSRWTDVPINDDMTVTIDFASYNEGLPEYDAEKGGYYLHFFAKLTGDKWAEPIRMYFESIKITGVL